MRPPLRPKASSNTLTMGTKQFVVQEALDTTTWMAGSNSWSFTPMTKVASASFEGAEMMTRRAPPSRWPAASLRDRETPRGLDHHLDAHLFPGQRLGLTFGQDPDPMPVHDESVTLGADLAVEAAVGGVVAQQVGVGPGVGQVVDGHDLYGVTLRLGRTQEVPADSSEAVDTYPDGHLRLTSSAIAPPSLLASGP